MRGVNKAIIIGNVGQDPETKTMPNGNQVTNISIATSEKWKDKNTGQDCTETEWHRVVFFNKLAEIAGQYLSKGSKVYIEGKLKTRKWQDTNGQDRYSTEIVANNMQMLDSRSDNEQGQQQAQQQQQPAGSVPQQQSHSNANGTAKTPQQMQQGQSAGITPYGQQAMDDFDSEDIPFS